MTDWQRPSKVGFLAWVDKTGRVQSAWSQSTDNVGVTRYKVFRNGQPLQRMPFPTDTLVDYKAARQSTYTYYVQARDPGNNWSLPSNAVTIRTP